MARKAKRVINVRDMISLQIRTSWSDGSFVLIFETRNQIVRIHCQRWWLRNIARKLWESIKSERKELERSEKALMGEE